MTAARNCLIHFCQVCVSIRWLRAGVKLPNIVKCDVARYDISISQALFRSIHVVLYYD